MRERIVQDLKLGKLLFEKCQLKESKECLEAAFESAKITRQSAAALEALAGLTRIACEAEDSDELSRLDLEIENLLKEQAVQVPPMIWYCRGVIARYQSRFDEAASCFLKVLRALRTQFEKGSQISEQVELVIRARLSLATLDFQRGRTLRAYRVAESLLQRYEKNEYPSINGTLYLLIGNVFEKSQDYAHALSWYHKAHKRFLQEHNWYYYIYVLYSYAQLERKRRNYSQAYWYLDLMDKAASPIELKRLRRLMADEKSRLEQDAVDLLIDSNKGFIRTREAGKIPLRKQYVLMNILEALSAAHTRPSTEGEQGLSKAELIEMVWKERYRPHAHDNKLYYNINRLRKLIEPDVKKPQYLLNWKEGYRLAPGLKVHRVNRLITFGSVGNKTGENYGGGSYERNSENEGS